MIWVHNENSYVGLQNRVSEEKWQSATRRKKRGGEECGKRQSEDKNKNPEGKRADGNGKCKERENLQRQSSEQPVCDQHLNHSWRLTPSPPEEVNCSHWPCERSSKHQPKVSERHLSHTHTHTFYREERYSEASVTGCHCKLIPNRY